jgi:hypothetical protein
MHGPGSGDADREVNPVGATRNGHPMRGSTRIALAADCVSARGYTSSQTRKASSIAAT